jgi:glutamyl-tRNA reductase
MAAPEIAAMLAPLVRAGAVSEAVVVSTCNRTELYAVEGGANATAILWQALSERLGEDASRFGYVHSGRSAAGHLYRVASGLDSMILGEAQIHGQVRDAWELSREFSGVALNRLFQSALQVASRVRTETGIGRGAASVSSAAVQLARQIFGSLRGREAMVLGAGDMAELALQCLVSEGVRAAIVANRSFERAAALASVHGARAMHFDECWDELASVDMLISSTAAPHPVVTVPRVRAALARRGGEPLCILDIALPRDVDPEVGKLGNVFLYDIDDLGAVVTANLECRSNQIPSAEEVIADEVERYWRWLSGLAAVPVLTRFRNEMDQLREKELQATLRRHPNIGADEREALEGFSRSLMNKFLHNPSVRLRDAAANGRGLGVIDAAQYLFALEEQAAGSDVEGAESTEESRRSGGSSEHLAKGVSGMKHGDLPLEPQETESREPESS